MARRQRRPTPTSTHILTPQRTACVGCGGPLWVAYHNERVVTTLTEVAGLTLAVRRCHNADCTLYHHAYRPEEEGVWALPHGEFGLDVIALVGALRYAEHRSVPEIHRQLIGQGVRIAERTVTHLVARYEELVALRLSDQARLCDRLAEQGRVILALDGLQPDMGHEVLWVLRDCLSGEPLLARSLLSGTADDIAALLREAVTALAVPVAGVISDGQHSIRDAVADVLPGVPHQLCHFHYLREAARPLFEADRHAKKELKKQVRGVRPIERAVEERTDTEARVVQGYCRAVRSALTDDGRPPLSAPGLRLRDRLVAVHASLQRVTGAEKGGSPQSLRPVKSLSAWSACSPAAWTRLRPPGQPSTPPMPTSIAPRTSSPMTTSARRRRSVRRTRR
jgi:hypothetical protein